MNTNGTPLDEHAVPCKSDVLSASSKKVKKKDEENPDLDGGWAWVVLVANCCANAINSALFYSFGIYYVVLLEEFKASRSITAWVGSLNNSIFMMAGPLATIILDKYGNRVTLMLAGIFSCLGYSLSSLAPNLLTLFFTHGFISAFGSCLNYTGWVIALGTYFKKKYALAFSIGQAGVGVGMFTLGPLFKSLIVEYGLRGAFLINGAIGLNFCAFGALVFPPRRGRASGARQIQTAADADVCKELLPDEKNLQVVDTHETLTTHAMFRDPRAWLLNMSCFFWLAATMIIYVLMQDLALSLSLGDFYMYTFSAMGVGDLIGRLFLGPIIDKFQLSATLANAVAQFACTVAILSLMLVFNGVQLVAQGFLFSVTYGLQCVCLALVPNEIYGPANLSLIFGFSMFFCGAGTLAGPPLAGLIIDTTGSFTGAITFAALCECLGAISALGCYICYRRRLQKNPINF